MKFVRALAAFAVVFSLVPAAVPRVDACPVPATAPHGCCAIPVNLERPTPSSCCGTEASRPPLSAAAFGSPLVRCDCVHAPAEPAAVAVGTPTPSLDDLHASPGLSPSGKLFRVRTTNGLRSALTLGSSSPPLLFILDCAFLI